MTEGLWAAIIGVGGTLGTQALLKKKKSKSDDQDA